MRAMRLVLLNALPLVLRGEMFRFAFVKGVKGFVLFLKAGMLLLLCTVLMVVEGVSLLLVAVVELWSSCAMLVSISGSNTLFGDSITCTSIFGFLPASLILVCPSHTGQSIWMLRLKALLVNSITCFSRSSASFQRSWFWSVEAKLNMLVSVSECS